ncbi:TetR/AcrR family transcriptional regulator [Haloechinothrix sp. YIM 98757]|uniref:TetR/AcrR family transcriptional regulator n=1 Tax=Haloechinothrix aidingensis TaxID=2752311 RepID=A0A838ACU8_9PSEU|nr:TetR/AcrR family transcriptional regulator [Haloechinothrix aidingensis]MBA0127092.1 TetR/AcrR family transcriptional regulator [Haloechinothrix aidingensis]
MATRPQRSYAGRSAAERSAERRERLMAAGLELFGTEGYAATSIEKLCTTAGVSTRNFYEEFSSRETLLMRLHDRVIERAMDAVVRALAGADDLPLRERVERGMRAYITTTAEDPRWARLSYVELVGISDAVERHRLDWRARWVEFLDAESRRAVARGEAADRDFQLGAVALIGGVNELVYHWSTGAVTGSLDDIIDELVRLTTALVTAS